MAHSAKQSTVGSFECRAIGTLSADNELAFQQLLTSMAGLPGLPVLQHAIVLKGPSQERSAPEIRLLHILASLPAAGGHDSGVVQHDRCSCAPGIFFPTLSCIGENLVDSQIRSAHRRLQNQRDSLYRRWLVQHEGLPLRGRGVAELPAAVRTVTVAHCDGADVLAFWQAMGFWLDHEMIQEGHRFALETTHQLQVRAVLHCLLSIATGHRF